MRAIGPGSALTTSHTSTKGGVHPANGGGSPPPFVSLRRGDAMAWTKVGGDGRSPSAGAWGSPKCPYQRRWHQVRLSTDSPSPLSFSPFERAGNWEPLRVTPEGFLHSRDFHRLDHVTHPTRDATSERRMGEGPRCRRSARDADLEPPGSSLNPPPQRPCEGSPRCCGRTPRRRRGCEECRLSYPFRAGSSADSTTRWHSIPECERDSRPVVRFG
jgi:hypothetical protein